MNTNTNVNLDAQLKYNICLAVENALKQTRISAIALKKAGYICSQELAKKIQLFEKAGYRKEQRIPAMFLTGEPGSGKTALAEAFADVVGANLLFVQCYNGMCSDNFIIQPNIASVLKKDAENAISEGILVKALKSTAEGPTVVVIDELDKTSTDVDALLLDFLNSGRITDGQNEWKKKQNPIWVFITSNENPELDSALINRCRKVHVNKIIEQEQLCDILHVKKEHHVIELVQLTEMSIRQAKEYLQDIDFADQINISALEQYIDCTNIEKKIPIEINSYDNSYKDFFENSYKNNFVEYETDNEIIFYDKHPKRFTSDRLFTLYQIKKLLQNGKMCFEVKYEDILNKNSLFVIDREFIEKTVNSTSGAIAKVNNFLINGYYYQGLFIAELSLLQIYKILNVDIEKKILINGKPYNEEYYKKITEQEEYDNDDYF